MRFPYHCGYLVEDLDRSLKRCEAVFGLRFREPESRALAPAAGFEDTIPAGEEIRFAFSVGDDFPFLELIEAQDGGLFGRAQGEGLHHVGFWVEDMAGVRATQEAEGLRTEARFDDPDGSERVFYAGSGTIRVESVNARLRPEYERWLKSGTPREGAR